MITLHYACTRTVGGLGVVGIRMRVWSLAAFCSVEKLMYCIHSKTFPLAIAQINAINTHVLSRFVFVKTYLSCRSYLILSVVVRIINSDLFLMFEP